MATWFIRPCKDLVFIVGDLGLQTFSAATQVPLLRYHVAAGKAVLHADTLSFSPRDLPHARPCPQLPVDR